MNTVQNIHQNSGQTDWRTDPRVLEICRNMAGGHFDLDPASSEDANKIVQARKIYTYADDGLAQPWVAHTLWLNFPFSIRENTCRLDCEKEICKKRGHHCIRPTPGNFGWTAKLVESWYDGLIGEAWCICFASTSEQWFAPLLDFPQFYFTGRLPYYLPDGSPAKEVPKGSVLTYLPRRSRLGVDMFTAGKRLAEAFRLGGFEGKAKVSVHG